MTKTEFTHLLKHPEKKLTEDEISILEHQIETYPYFQSLRAIHLKNLKQNKSYKFATALKQVATLTSNRKVLFHFINPSLSEAKIHQQSTKNPQASKDKSDKQSLRIDDSLKAQIEATEGVLDPNLFEKPKNIKTFESNTLNESSNEQKSNLLKSNTVNVTTGVTQKQHSFSEWLKLTGTKQVDPSLPSKVGSFSENIGSHHPIKDKLETIDRFLQENPKIVPSKSETPSPVVLKTDQTISESIMTETLARIYLEQKNYNKAIKAYKILSLKYPEKSSFFANRILLIEDLKNQK